jgi:hypothetical protein
VNILPNTMNLCELKSILVTHREALVRFRLPDGTLVPPHAHITEVGLVTKSFVDCGGTARSESKCLLQSWVADDVDHRLSAGKLLSIIEKGDKIFSTEDLPVELEHDLGFATQFQLLGSEVVEGELILQAAGRHTACLAPEKCCPPSQDPGVVSLGRKRG